jgi:[protein-PII] uridylyltransferase
MADSSPPLRETCAEYLEQHRASLEQAIHAGQHGVDVARRYAAMYDGLFGSLCCAADAESRGDGKELGRVALVAVGGYGRRLVAPHSDVDVLFLCDDPTDERILRMAEQVLYPLWDVGVDIGHAVRGLEETLDLSESDIRTSTTLLDLRHVTGDRAIVQELEERGRERIFSAHLPRFVEALESDTAGRHERFGDSLYLTEPELKLGRGGLRDLDIILWCAKARYGVDSLTGAVDHGMLTEHELGDLEAAQEHLWRVRNLLHLQAGRRNDRFTYEEQQAVAAAMGYRDGMSLAVEQIMHHHFQHARAIARVADRIGHRVRRSLRPPPTTIRDLGGGVLVHDGKVTLKSMDLEHEPAVAMRFYAFVASEKLPPDSAARDAISAVASDRDWCQRLRHEPEASKVLRQLLTEARLAPVRRGSMLEELHEVGLLLAMIPELEAVTGRLRHDAFHVYTVDAQAILAVDRLRAAVRGDLASEHLAVSRCAAELTRPLPLHLALLLHGLGIGHPDVPAKHAAALSGLVGERLGMGDDEIEHMQWLITEQSSMYHWATRRDITDPETIDEVAEAIRDVERLDDLYLFTFCYISTANPRAMSAWNARMLQDLWTAVTQRLEGQREDREALARLRRDAVEGIDDAGRRAQIEQFMEQVPTRYLRANTVDGIRFHSSVVLGREGVLGFGATHSGVGEGTLELVIACDDRPGLLADLTAALAGGRFSVDSAQLYTRKRPGLPDEAFDLFHVSHSNMLDSVLIEQDLEQLRGQIERVLRGEVEAHELLGRRSRPSPWARQGPKIKTEIHVDNASSTRYTVVDVYTRDRTDLLYVIADTLHERGLTIGFAKVNTEGERAVDVFYVQTRDGQKLSGDGQLAELSKALRDVIRSLD